jgi:hypothetical protein
MALSGRIADSRGFGLRRRKARISKRYKTQELAATQNQ